MSKYGGNIRYIWGNYWMKFGGAEGIRRGNIVGGRGKYGEIGQKCWLTYEGKYEGKRWEGIF